jgi:DNA uptake protein and related DNA-binding proteins
MPTPSEQKALAFVAIVILLGGAVRVLRAGAVVQTTPAEQQGLAAQAAAADDAARSGKQSKGRTKRRSSRSTPDTLPRVIGGVASVPPTYARPDRPYDRIPYGADRGARPAPVPSPRIDTDARGLQAAPPVVTGAGKKAPGGIIDMDHASAEEIEQLPRIGLATARRIVANRDSLGPFGSLDGLRRVKGMGPASLTRLAPFISFGGRPAGAPKPP